MRRTETYNARDARPARPAQNVMKHCPAARYPRSLSAVLPPSDAKHLSHVYFEHVRKNFGLRYYGLLHFLGHAADEDYARALSILHKMQARIEAERRRDPRYRVQQQQAPYGQPGYGQPRYRPRTY